MKDFHCRDVGMDCDWVARGNTEQEILDQAGRHGQQKHRLNMTPELEQKVRGLIHDESSEEHRRSTSRG
jgi:predicted small metal-binding protein